MVRVWQFAQRRGTECGSNRRSFGPARASKSLIQKYPRL